MAFGALETQHKRLERLVEILHKPSQENHARPHENLEPRTALSEQQLCKVNRDVVEDKHLLHDALLFHLEEEPLLAVDGLLLQLNLDLLVDCHS